MKKSKTKLKYKEGIVIVICGMFLIYLAAFLNLEDLTNYINRTLPPREAALAAGMILGDKTGFDSSLNTDLKNSGLMHLVVISGANLMILMTVVINGLTGVINRKIAIIIGILLTWIFVGIVGWQVSILRAVLMVSLIYWAQLLGRKFSISRSVFLVFLLMVIIDYHFLKDVSFWLSFTAYLGVLAGKGRWSVVWVTLWTMPIVSIYFGKVSIISPIANGLVIGLSELVTVFGLVGVMVGQFFSSLGAGILLLILPVLRYFLYVVDLFGQLAFASMEMTFNVWMLVGWYLILGTKCFLVNKKE